MILVGKYEVRNVLLKTDDFYPSQAELTVAPLCYNGDVSFLRETLEIGLPVKFKPLNILSQILSQLIPSMNVSSNFQVW